MAKTVLVINAGSSSIKFQVFIADEGKNLTRRFGGQLEGLGVCPHFIAKDAGGEVLSDRRWQDGKEPAGHKAGMQVLIGWLRDHVGSVDVIGHRVVHGGVAYAAPVRIDGAVRDALERLVPLAPLHQPHNLTAIDAVGRAYPGVPQVACFDTAFHRTHPKLADCFALPARYYDAGVRRYGFHGLSYEFIARRLTGIDPALAKGRVIVAHLGNGASMCGLVNGVSMDSTMGFTALDGLCMGTRCGQIDPGVLLHLMDHDGMDTRQITQLLYQQSGLRGISGVSSDMRDLIASADPAAQEAIAYFVYHIQRNFGALVAAIGGVDALVFTGGIGENAADIRARVAKGLEWAGLRIDAGANAAGKTEFSAAGSAVRCFVIRTNEEMMIARHALGVVASHDQYCALRVHRPETG